MGFRLDRFLFHRKDQIPFPQFQNSASAQTRKIRLIVAHQTVRRALSLVIEKATERKIEKVIPCRNECLSGKIEPLENQGKIINRPQTGFIGLGAVIDDLDRDRKLPLCAPSAKHRSEFPVRHNSTTCYRIGRRQVIEEPIRIALPNRQEGLGKSRVSG